MQLVMDTCSNALFKFTSWIKQALFLNNHIQFVILPAFTLNKYTLNLRKSSTITK